MKLEMPVAAADAYKSQSQIARVLTETWAEDNLYCISCTAPSIDRAPNNARAVDFWCNGCDARYQLKASRQQHTRRVPDAGYDAMMEAVLGDRCPNLLVLHYEPSWRVANLVAVPSFCFTPSVIERRKPLAPTARRAGWVGCNIRLDRIPLDSRLTMVRTGVPSDASEVRAAYKRMAELAKADVATRAWTLDVLTCVRAIGKQRFSLDELDEVYRFEDHLAALHPKNKHVRPKIRQQLQVLRDMGLIHFLGAGRYAVN